MNNHFNFISSPKGIYAQTFSTTKATSQFQIKPNFNGIVGFLVSMTQINVTNKQETREEKLRYNGATGNSDIMSSVHAGAENSHVYIKR